VSGHSTQLNIRRLSNGNFRIANFGINQDRFAGVKLYDCSGKIVQTVTSQKIQAAGLVLETSLLGKGIYLLEIVKAGERMFVKLANY
jgi:myo-inositol-hexaphosphate 3-phosphohydrolase